MMALGKPKLRTKFKVTTLSCLRNITGKPQNFRELPYTIDTPTFSAWDVMMVLGKPQRFAKFEVAGFIYYGNIREFVFENW